ncbi:uncharacterized protein LOC141618618 [Silene latifolia]|uniref:uncharacterized protein LOC141618618 n=1 Tax=Silene latifolia TaxID=37657 RepID=UPI003D78194F
MIISTWNIRGFNKPVKHLEVLSFIKENNIDVLGLLETRVKKNKAHRILQSRFRRMNSFTNYNAHYNGRIWILWNPVTTSVSIVEEHAQVVHCQVRHFATGRTFHLSVVYGSKNASLRQQLWQSLSDFAVTGGPWVTMGDFNVVRHFTEKISDTPPVFSELAEFNNCLLDCGLDDLQGTGADFTWFNKHDISSKVYSKLDRVMVNSDWFQHYPQTSAQFKPPGVSDHCPVILVRGNPMFRLMEKLNKVRLGLKNLHNVEFSNIGQRIKDKKVELAQCFEDLQKYPLSEAHINKEKLISDDFLKLKEAETSILIQKAKLHDIKHNDFCSAYFFC